MEAKNRRHQAMVAVRKGMVVSAAKTVIARLGLESASIREIAKEAGYTPGALYAYFASKNDLLVTMLEDVLVSLAHSVANTQASKSQTDLLLVKGDAWMAHLLMRPNDLELLMYFLSRAGQSKLDAEMTHRIHSALRQTLEPLAQALLSSGLVVERLDAEMEALLAFVLGLLLTPNAARPQLGGQTRQSIFSDYLKRLRRDFSGVDLESEALTRPGKDSMQVDLFEG
jgi:AcrR family transcriptional regulator